MKRVYKRKLTLWFTGDTCPKRPGVYQVSGEPLRHRRGSPIFYAYWNGAKWSIKCRTPFDAAAMRRYQVSLINAWRGRTEP